MSKMQRRLFLAVVQALFIVCIFALNTAVLTAKDKNRCKRFTFRPFAV